MLKKSKKHSWDRLDPFRGRIFEGEWPSIPEQFQIALDQYPDKTAFTAFSPEELHFTYKEAYEYILNTSYYLLNNGVKEGDKVVLTGKNSPYWAMAYLAVVELGAVIVPIDYQLTPENINRLAEFAEADFYFIDKEKYDNVAPDVSSERKVSLSPEKPNFIIDLKKTKPVKYSRPKTDNLAAILFTSGTTGNEKGVMLTHKNFMTDAYMACDTEFLYGEQSDVWYALLPLHHSYCMTAVFLESIVHGSEMVFAAGLAVGNIMNDLKKGKVTMVMGIPLLYNKILKGLMKQVQSKGVVAHILIGVLMKLSGMIKLVFRINPGKIIFKGILKKANLYNVKYLISGGGPLAPETFRRYNQLGLDFVQGYGLTETSPIVALNPAKKFKVKSVGKTFPFCDFRILNPDKKTGVGEVAIKGPTNCVGYYKNEEATRELFTADGFLKTGDLGYLDRQSYLYLTGREKSLIVTEGGKNIFPEEIEEHFQLHSQVEQVLIKGYIANAETCSEGIEAVLYPSKEHFDSLGFYNDEKIKAVMIHIVKTVNRELLSYQRISRIHILKDPMEMTTTKKIKRLKVLELLKTIEDNGFKL